MEIFPDNPVMSVCDALPCALAGLLAASSPGEDQALAAAYHAGGMVSAILPIGNVVNDGKVVISAHIEPAMVGVNSSPTGIPTQELQLIIGRSKPCWTSSLTLSKRMAGWSAGLLFQG